MFGHWYLVTSQKTALFLTEEAKSRELKLIKFLDNPLGRERNSALVRKQAGKGVHSVSGRVGGVHYSERKRHDPHEQAAIQFAKQINKFLSQQRQKEKFKTLTVVAEPNFLGKLKSDMRKELKGSVIEWLGKDLLKTPKKKMTNYLLEKSVV